MRITLNGEDKETQAQTVAMLLREMDAPVVGTAVAVNGRVVRRAEQEECELQNGDEVELIRAVQGG